MGTTGKRRTGRALALVVGAAAVALPLFSASPASAVVPTLTFSDSDTQALPSLPDTIQMEVDQLDPVHAAGLTGVTVTATVDGQIVGTVENLSGTAPKTISTSLTTGISVTDAGIISPLVAQASDSAAVTIAPGATQGFSLMASDSTSEEFTTFTPDLVNLLVGNGTVVFDVLGSVGTSVSGPAPYLSTGVAEGEATIEIEYEYEEQACEYDANLSSTDPECVPTECPDEEAGDGHWEDLQWHTWTGGPVDSDGGPQVDADGWHPTQGTPNSESHSVPPRVPNVPYFVSNQNSGKGSWFLWTGTWVESEGEDCEPPPTDQCPDMDGLQTDPQQCEPTSSECVDEAKIDDLPDPLVEGATYTDGGGVELTIDALHEDNSFDWSSNVEIVWLQVKGGSENNGGGDGPLFDYPGGATSGTDVHAPFNLNSASDGKYFAASHIVLCYEPSPEVCEWDPQLPPDVDDCQPPCEYDEQLLSTDEGCVPPCEYDRQLSSTDEGCVPPPPPPPPECVDQLKIEGFGDNPVGGPYSDKDGNVSLTIDAVHEDKSFDWSSDVAIVEMWVKGGSNAGGGGDDPTDASHEYFDYSPGATSGTAHAPHNPNSGKWYGLSHLEVCLGETAEESQPSGGEPRGRGEQGVSGEKGGPGGKPEKSPSEKSNAQEPSAEPSPAPEPESDPAPKKKDEAPAAPEPEPEPEAKAKEPEPPAKEEKAKPEEDDEDSEGDDEKDGDKAAKAGTAGAAEGAGDDAGSEGQGDQ